MKLKLGLDFDGVISDCGKLKSMFSKSLYGLDIPPEKLKKEIVVREGYLTLDQYRNIQKIIYGTRGAGLRMEPVPGMSKYLPKIQESGHKVLVVTSRSGHELQIAREWSLMKGLKLDFIGVGYGHSKAEAAKGLDLYVDDDLEKIEPLIGIVPHRYLFSKSYNAHVDAGKIAKRVGSWQELWSIVHSLAPV